MIKLQNTIIHCRILWQTDFKIIPVNPSPGIPATCVYINSLPLSMDKTCDLLVNNQVQKKGQDDHSYAYVLHIWKIPSCWLSYRVLPFTDLEEENCHVSVSGHSGEAT